MNPSTGSFAYGNFGTESMPSRGSKEEVTILPFHYAPLWGPVTSDSMPLGPTDTNLGNFPSSASPVQPPWSVPAPSSDSGSTVYSLVSFPVTPPEGANEEPKPQKSQVFLEHVPTSLLPNTTPVNHQPYAQKSTFTHPASANIMPSPIKHHPAFEQSTAPPIPVYTPLVVPVPELPVLEPQMRFFLPTEAKTVSENQNPSSELPSARFQFVTPPPTYSRYIQSQTEAQAESKVHTNANGSDLKIMAPPPSYASASPLYPVIPSPSVSASPLPPPYANSQPPSTPISKSPSSSPSKLFYTPSPSMNSSYHSSSPLSAPMSETKGMENPAGENHCFLNVLIQSLYRLTEFRERFLQIAHHHSMLDVAGDGSACVLCSLQTIWNAYKQRDLPGSLNPSGVRSALAHLDDAFARYKQADAGETLLRILDHLHEQLTKSHPSNLTLSPLLAPSSEALSLALCSSDVKSRCLIHELFAWETQTITRCPRCDDHVKGEMGWTLLVDGTKLKKEWSLLSSTPRLGRLVTDPSNLSETLISCPNERCSERQAKRNVALLSAPPIFQISISWPWDPTDTAMPRIKQAATDLLNAIDSPLYLKDMYASASKSDAEYRLQGFVAYYGLHYVAYQLVRRSDGPPIWHHFNDANVHVLSTWQDCKESVHKGGYLPVLLWYVRKPSRN